MAQLKTDYMIYCTSNSRFIRSGIFVTQYSLSVVGIVLAPSTVIAKLASTSLQIGVAANLATILTFGSAFAIIGAAISICFMPALRRSLFTDKKLNNNLHALIGPKENVTALSIMAASSAILACIISNFVLKAITHQQYNSLATTFAAMSVFLCITIPAALLTCYYFPPQSTNPAVSPQGIARSKSPQKTPFKHSPARAALCSPRVPTLKM
jgi:hypothetical protein